MDDARVIQTYFHSILDLANALSRYIDAGLRIPDSLGSDVLAATGVLASGPHRTVPNGWALYRPDEKRLEIKLFGPSERCFDDAGRETGERPRLVELSYALR